MSEPSAELVAMVDDFGQCCIGYGEWDGYDASSCIDDMVAARRKLLARIAELEKLSSANQGAKR
jgi:hypothetical protein